MSTLRTMLRPVARSARVARAHAQGLTAYMAGRAADTVRVAYALPVPDEDAPAVGGIVKLQHLARLFPDDPRRFNVLYLVTSRLPAAAVVLADWARRKGARLVVNQNGVAYPGWHGPGWDRVNAEMGALLARADHVFYQSAFCRESADRFAGPPAGASEVLYNAVDTQRFVPMPKAGGRALTCLLAGSQDFWYRVESAVLALAEIVRRGVDAELLISGRLGWSTPVDARAQTEALLERARMTDRVELVGPYAQRDAPSLFARADIVLHTKYNDPCPTAVIEAMACGRPVVYSGSGGVPELVGDHAGIAVKAEQSWERTIPPDPTGLADAICRVRERLPEYQRAARERAVTHFDVRHWLERHRQMFEQLVGV